MWLPIYSILAVVLSAITVYTFNILNLYKSNKKMKRKNPLMGAVNGINSKYSNVQEMLAKKYHLIIALSTYLGSIVVLIYFFGI